MYIYMCLSLSMHTYMLKFKFDRSDPFPNRLVVPDTLPAFIGSVLSLTGRLAFTDAPKHARMLASMPTIVRRHTRERAASPITIHVVVPMSWILLAA